MSLIAPGRADIVPMHPSLCVCFTPKGHLFTQPQREVGGHHRPGGRQAISQRGCRLSH